MRIALVDTLYPAFAVSHYSARPGLAEQPYGEQLASLLAATFGTSDAYSTGLRAAGHEAIDLIANVDPLQARWQVEHGGLRVSDRVALRLPGRAGDLARLRLRASVLEAQLDACAPDVVYLQDLGVLDRAGLDRQRAKGRLVVGQIASAAPDEGILRGYDLILTSFPHFVERFRALGIASEPFRIGFHEDVLRRLRERGIDPAPDAPGRAGVVFAGGLDPRVHGAGVALLEHVAREREIAVYGYGADRLAADSPLRSRYRGETWGLEMYRVLATSQIALNRHIAAAEGCANNMRLYEATGVGTCLLTDRGYNLGELFEAGQEVAVYDDADSLLAEIDRLLADDAARIAIATAGQRRTLAEHTYARRMEELAMILDRYRQPVGSSA